MPEKVIRQAVRVGKGTFYIVADYTFTFDPASLVDGAGATSADQAVPGARLGDWVGVAAPYDLQGCTVTGYVKAADTIVVRVQNESGGAVDLASGTWRVKVTR